MKHCHKKEEEKEETGLEGIKEPLPNILQTFAFLVRMLLPSPLTEKGYDLILYVDLLESPCYDLEVKESNKWSIRENHVNSPW